MTAPPMTAPPMTGRRVQRLRAFAGLSMAAGLMVGCGIPAEDTAQIIDEPRPELFETIPETTSTTEPPPGETVNLRLYWHTDRDILVIVNRAFSESPTIQEALDALTQGPSLEEQGRNPTTFIQRKFNVSLAPRYLSLDLETGEAIIQVADAALFRDDTNRRIAASELVCTAVQYKNIDSVTIVDSLGIIPLTDLDAEPIDGPAMAVHYDDCMPPEVPAADTDEDANG